MCKTNKMYFALLAATACAIGVSAYTVVSELKTKSISALFALIGVACLSYLLGYVGATVKHYHETKKKLDDTANIIKARFGKKDD